MNKIENEIVKGINLELTRGRKAFYIGNDEYIRSFYAFCDNRENMIVPLNVKGNVKKIQDWLIDTIKRISKTTAYKKGWEIEKDKARSIFDDNMYQQYLTTVGYVHLLVDDYKGCCYILENE